MGFEEFGKILIFVGILIVISGVIIFFIGRNFSIKKLPGDIFYKNEKITVFFPIVSMIVISIILTIVVNVILFFIRK